MLVDEGDELLIGQTEYIVLNKYTQDGKKYLFVANVNNPNENIAENFDSEALELLLLSQDEIKDEENSDLGETTTSGFTNEYNNMSDIYSDNSVKSSVVKENSQFFTVEKEKSKIEKILEIMFLK